LTKDPILEKLEELATSHAEANFAKMLAEIANKQLIEQGYRVPFDTLLEAFKKIRRDFSSANKILEATLSSILPQNSKVNISFGDEESKEISQKTQELTEVLSDAMSRTIRKMQKSNSRDFMKRWPAEDRLLKNEQHNFSFRLDGRWGKALSLLRLMLHLSRELGSMYTDKHSKSRSKKTLYFRRAIVPIHVRACQVLDEIICLLQNGFADGALARWRTLHELSIVAQLLEEGPDDLSRRYNAHQIVVRKKEIDDARLRFGGRLTSLQRGIVDDVESEYAASLLEFGANFRHMYGWASEYLSKNSPTFDDLQKKVSDGPVHENYKQACYSVHASTPATFFGLTTPYGDGLVVGASNYGLNIPGIAAAFSIVRVDAVLAGKRSEIIDLVIIGSLLDIRNKVAKEFLSVATQIDFEEFEMLGSFDSFEELEI
jgi:Family of unknown function (DUF5677)